MQTIYPLSIFISVFSILNNIYQLKLIIVLHIIYIISNLHKMLGNQKPKSNLIKIKKWN